MPKRGRYDGLRHVRGTRVHIPGAVYHLRTTTVGRLPLLADDACKHIALDALKCAAAAASFDVLAYVIMPEHVHLVVRPTSDATISQFIALFKQRSARRINRHLGRRGSLWRKEFFDHVLRSHEHLEELVRYIHDNPVRRGLASSADEWEFSSWREVNR